MFCRFSSRNVTQLSQRFHHQWSRRSLKASTWKLGILRTKHVVMMVEVASNE